MPDPPKVFISHTTQDERDFALAHYLAEGLRERGAQVWVAPDNIPAGAQWEQEIIKSILEECTYFLVILSAASIASEWVLKEIELAKQRYNQNHAFCILPLRVGHIKEFPSRDFTSQFQELKYHQDRLDQLDEVAAALDLSLAIWPQYLQKTCCVIRLQPLSLRAGAIKYMSLYHKLSRKPQLFLSVTGMNL
ncbi:MAG: toll/interleukin-1 receptor domain-containing protein, partial [Pyrinomonadaceae bacterium]